MKKAIIIPAIVFAIVALGLIALAESAQASDVCGPLDSGKIDTTGDPASVTITATSGYEITGYCVKAGSSQQGDGPEYVTVDPPQTSITITHSTQKAVSHYSWSEQPITTDTTSTTSSTTTTTPPTTTEPPSSSTTVAPTTTVETSTTTSSPPTTSPPATPPTTTPDTTVVSTTEPPSVTSTPPSTDPPVSSTTPPSSPTPELPATGTDDWGPMIVVAALLLLAGGTLAWMARREDQ